MSIATSELQAMLDTLRRARSSGVLMIRHGDERVDYKSDADMQAAENALEKQIALANGTSRPRLRRAYQSSKGL
ncbi:phage head-tail joining protein [Mesorhizobium opportunistum]|uniref:Uncharacterized protein n=1 Tax=Mesorhizobium opportunistum (strain LMG 24607 / HAMBI 3007 / WSM2075) TaxID=536019 RepID=F7XZX1_MESOW|nr:hypothetical protein [Mesorhizobium opportunistum]AEH88185.1 conserved hypothetical protein [Mesorhizobium opportunistum WSM2075]